jgi:hypothetical protein
MKFIFKVLAKSPPAVCIVGGIFLITISKVAGLGGSLVAFGALLIFAGIGLQVYYLYMKYRK